MYIECGSCPGRQIACDGCMMQVLFSPLASGDAPVAGGETVTDPSAAADAEIDAALDVLAAAAMVTMTAVRSARSSKTNVQEVEGGRHLRILRAG